MKNGNRYSVTIGAKLIKIFGIHNINQEKNTIKKKALRLISETKCSSIEKVAASYSPALHCSTIGAGGLNFSVRNGKRWDPAAITT